MVERYRLIDGAAAKAAAELHRSRMALRGLAGTSRSIPNYTGKGLEVQFTIDDPGHVHAALVGEGDVSPPERPVGGADLRREHARVLRRQEHRRAHGEPAGFLTGLSFRTVKLASGDKSRSQKNSFSALLLIAILDVPRARRRTGNVTMDMLKAPEIERHWALFLDLDGTLLDIAAAPDKVVIPPAPDRCAGARRSALDGALAVVSGRRLANIDRLLSPLRLPVAAEHGAVIRLPSGAIDSVSARAPSAASWVEQLRRRRATGTAFWSRRKPIRLRSTIGSRRTAGARCASSRCRSCALRPNGSSFSRRSRRSRSARRASPRRARSKISWSRNRSARGSLFSSGTTSRTRTAWRSPSARRTWAQRRSGIRGQAACRARLAEARRGCTEMRLDDHGLA